MMEEEAKAIMRAHKWTYHIRSRRSLGKQYIYAQRRVGNKRLERYICPLSRLGELTEEKLVAKLTQVSGEKS